MGKGTAEWVAQCISNGDQQMFGMYKKAFNEIDSVATSDASGRFAAREAKKLHFL